MAACHCNPLDTRNCFQSQHPQVVTSRISKILSKEDVDWPPFCHCRNTTTTWRFIHYSWWIDVLSYPVIRTGHALPWTLQTALLNVVGASKECNLKERKGVESPKAIGIVISSRLGHSLPLFCRNALGPDLHMPPFKKVHFGVLAWCVYSKRKIVLNYNKIF